MIDAFPLRAYLCQIPLRTVIDNAKGYGVSDTIALYSNRSGPCQYAVSKYLYQNEYAAVYDDYNLTIMVSLKDNYIVLDRYRSRGYEQIDHFGQWQSQLVKMTYEDFLETSKMACKEMLSSSSEQADKLRDIAAHTEMKSITELCDVTESVAIPGLFDAATEASDDDIAKGLNNLDKLSGDAGDNNAGSPAKDDGGATDLTKATQDQLDEDNKGESDDPFADVGDMEDPFADTGDDSGDASSDDSLSSDTGDTSSDASTSGGDSDDKSSDMDPMKSVEVKKTYRDRFVKLYNVIEDSLTVMETFTPDYNTKISAKYYTLQMDLTHLKESIYRICTRRLNKMSVPEVLRAYRTANITYDVISNKMKEFFDEYNTEVDKMNKQSGK